mmetsp:Transcript_13315/g.42546  ORF Transcript_13315/g.42546 Transcript_13315/m.42546 type:complete len:494 (+) Transcript_13315:3864-5345(+)
MQVLRPALREAPPLLCACGHANQYSPPAEGCVSSPTFCPFTSKVSLPRFGRPPGIDSLGSLPLSTSTTKKPGPLAASSNEMCELTSMTVKPSETAPLLMRSSDGKCLRATVTCRFQSRSATILRTTLLSGCASGRPGTRACVHRQNRTKPLVAWRQASFTSESRSAEPGLNEPSNWKSHTSANTSCLPMATLTSRRFFGSGSWASRLSLSRNGATKSLPQIRTWFVVAWKVPRAASTSRRVRSVPSATKMTSSSTLVRQSCSQAHISLARGTISSFFFCAAASCCCCCMVEAARMEGDEHDELGDGRGDGEAAPFRSPRFAAFGSHFGSHLRTSSCTSEISGLSPVPADESCFSSFLFGATAKLPSRKSVPVKRCHTASGRSFGYVDPSNCFAPSKSVNWNDFVCSSDSSRPFHRTSKQPGSTTGGMEVLPPIDGQYSRTSRHEPCIPPASQVPSKALVIDGHARSAERVAAPWPSAACGNFSSRCWSRIWRC